METSHRQKKQTSRSWAAYDLSSQFIIGKIIFYGLYKSYKSYKTG